MNEMINHATPTAPSVPCIPARMSCNELSSSLAQCRGSELWYRHNISGESLFLRKLVLGIPAQASGKNLTRPLMPSAPRFVLVTSSRPNKGSEHWLQMT